MELVFTRQAKQDLADLTADQVAAVKDKLETVQAHPTSHQDTTSIRLKDRQLYQLTIKENYGDTIDHRIIYDLDKTLIRVYSILHRDYDAPTGS